MYTRASLTDVLARILARKIAPRVGQVGEDVGVGVVDRGMRVFADTQRHRSIPALAERRVGKNVRFFVGCNVYM